MQGAIAPASSNANYKSGQVGEPHKHLFAKHTWISKGSSAKEEVGPLEIRFEKPTSLVSLNVDICLETLNSAEFLK